MLLLSVAAPAYAQTEEPPATSPPTSTATPPATATPPDADAEVPPPPRPKNFGPTLLADAGWGHRSFYGTPVNGGAFDLGAGAWTGKLTAVALFDLLVGATDAGLATRVYRFGGQLDFALLERLRVGGGVFASLVSVSRVTSDASFNSGGIGASAHLTMDLWQPAERQGLYLVARISIDSVGRVLGSSYRKEVSSFFTWGSTLGVGYRF